MNPLDAICNTPRDDAICVNQLKNAREIDQGLLQERPDVKIFLPFRFLFYRPEDVFRPNTYNRYLGKLKKKWSKQYFCNVVTTHLNIDWIAVAPTGDHVISLVDEISFTFPPAPPISQINDIPPEQFCNGDNRPSTCGANCMCTHKVDIPLNAVVEVVLVDEGALHIRLVAFKLATIFEHTLSTFKWNSTYLFLLFLCSPTAKLVASIPLARILIQRHRYGSLAGQKCQKDQSQTRPRLGQKRTPS